MSFTADNSACSKPVMPCLVLALLFAATASSFAQVVNQPGAEANDQRPAGKAGDTWPSVLPNPDALREISVQSTVQQLVDQLDHAKYAKRRSATMQLRELRVNRKQYYALLAHDGLSPEQRHRLLNVVRYRLLHMPRGALGISMQRQAPDDGVRITALIPDMPAERVLKVGDVIVAISGKAIKSSEELVEHVQSKRPGDSIQLTVERVLDNPGNGNGKPQAVDVELVLGSTRDLFNGSQRNNSRPSRFEQARQREARLAVNVFASDPRPLKIQSWSKTTTRADEGEQNDRDEAIQ